MTFQLLICVLVGSVLFVPDVEGDSMPIDDVVGYIKHQLGTYK